MGNLDQGLLFIISAPAGTGKSTLVEMLLAEFPDQLIESCSCTTRAPRLGEIAEKHYLFLTLAEFEAKVEKGEFLEYAKVFGNYYGTLKEQVFSQQQLGKHVILVIDTQGAMKLKGKVPATYIFITPPTMEELRRRLFKRKTENEEKILERLTWAEQEMSMAKEYDYHIVNEDLATTYQVLKSIIIAEEHKLADNREK